MANPFTSFLKFFDAAPPISIGGRDLAKAAMELRAAELETEMDDFKIPRQSREHGAAGDMVMRGDSGLIIPRQEYNPDWRGTNGIQLAERMRKSDGSVRSVLQAIKLPLRRASWRVSPSDPEGGDDKDKEIAEFCNKNLFLSDLRHETWDTVLRHILMMLDFGFSVVEKVWTVDAEGNYVPQRLAPRLPQTIVDFQVNPNGTLKNVIQRAYKNGREQELVIPAKYAMVFTYEKEGDSYWGVPLLRFLYQHWFYKTEMYRIDAVRLDRFGIGIPVGQIEKGYVMKPNEKREVVALLKGLRSHERAFALLPEEIQIKIMTPENERGGASGLMESVDHHDVMMARAALALFLTAGSQKHGNYGTTVTWQDLFLYSLQSLALQVGQDLQRQLVREMCVLNFDMKDRQFPKVEASTLEDTNVKEVAAALYNLVLGQVVIPDDETERWIRRTLGMPVKQEGYDRETLGIKGLVPGSPAAAAGNTSGQPSDDDKQAQKRAEPAKGTKPSTNPPPAGPKRVPGELG